MRNAFFALGLLLILFVSGCTSQQLTPQQPSAPQANATQPAPAQPPSQPPSPPPAAMGWAHYSNIGISFDYPKQMNVTEQLGSYPGYATILAQGKNVSTGAIVVGFINFSGISSVLPDPLAQASRVLESDSKDKDDITGQAQVQGEVSTYVSPNGVPLAERSFILTKPGTSGNNVTMYGYAIEFYDPGIKASYPVRIFSADQGWTDSMKARFLSTFKTGQ
jgi:hypothetical protein